MIAWAAIATASRVKARKVQMVSASCMVASVGVAESRGGVRHHQQGGAQHQRPHDQGYAGRGRPAGCPGRSGCSDAASRRAARTTTAHERRGRADLGEQRAQRRAGDAEPVEQPDAVDQHDVERDVGRRCRRRPPRAGCGCPAGRAARRWRRASAAAAPRRAGRGAGTSRPGRRPGRRARRAPTIGSVSGSTTRRGQRRRSAIASQSPSTPWVSAPRVSPAPTWRATEAVVP